MRKMGTLTLFFLSYSRYMKLILSPLVLRLSFLLYFHFNRCPSSLPFLLQDDHFSIGDGWNVCLSSIFAYLCSWNYMISPLCSSDRSQIRILYRTLLCLNQQSWVLIPPAWFSVPGIAIVALLFLTCNSFTLNWNSRVIQAGWNSL